MTMRNRTDDRGFAMIVVLGYMMVITILSSIFFKSVSMSVMQQQHNIQQTKAHALAESGVHYSVAKLRVDEEYVGEIDIVLGEGFFTTSVSPSSIADAWVIESTGNMGEGGLVSCVVRATVAKTANGWETLRWERIRLHEISERNDS